MKLRSAAKTHVGLVRQNNEDAFLCDDALGLYAVADGMGGQAAGEVASRLAIETLKRYTANGDPSGWLMLAFREANKAIINDTHRNHERAGMGTTLTVLAVDGNRAAIAHVGDSRCILVRDGVGRQLTHDHVAPGSQHVLLNCLGGDPGSHIKTDYITEEVKPGDVFVLCSDGLGDYIQARCIAHLAQWAREGSDADTFPHLLGEKLVADALDMGDADNITVVVVAVEE